MHLPYILDKIINWLKAILRWHNSLEYDNTRVLIDTVMIFVIVTALSCIIVGVFYKGP